MRLAPLRISPLERVVFFFFTGSDGEEGFTACVGDNDGDTHKERSSHTHCRL